MITLANIRRAVYYLNKRIDLLELNSISGGGTSGGSSSQDYSEIRGRIEALESIISEGSNPTAAIDKFNEIVTFLNSIENTDTLAGLLADIVNQIPTNVSDLENDTGYLTQHQDISGKEDKSNKVTSWQSTPDNTHYPSEKLVKESINDVDNVYIADSSTYDRLAVTAALNAGKMVFLKYDNSIWAYNYSTANDSHHFFGWYTNGGAQGLKDVYNNGDVNIIYSVSRGIQSYLIKTTVVGNEASDNYYPSTKAVADYAEKKTDIVAPVNTTDDTLPITALSCEVGKYYRIDVAIDTLAVTLPEMIDTTTVRTVVIYLTAGSTPALTITSADAKNVYYQDGFEIEAGNTYEINALFNGAAWIVASVKINVE